LRAQKRKTAFAAGALPRIPLVELTALPRPSSWVFEGGKEWGKEGKEREKEREKREGDPSGRECPRDKFLATPIWYSTVT